MITKELVEKELKDAQKKLADYSKSGNWVPSVSKDLEDRCIELYDLLKRIEREETEG